MRVLRERAEEIGVKSLSVAPPLSAYGDISKSWYTFPFCETAAPNYSVISLCVCVCMCVLPVLP